MLAMGMASALVPVRVKADFPIGLVDVRAAMPLDANAELGSAYRCDLPGPEVWTSTCGDKALDGTADGYFKTEVPAGRFGVPAPGMSGLLHVVHMVPNVKDPVSLEIVEGNVRIALVPVRNHWTPSFMTTYYRSLPNAASPADEKRVGRIVLKERKAVLADNTFLAEATVKNTSSLSLACRVSVKTQGGLPVPGHPAKAWRFTTRSMGRDVERITCTASGTSFGGGAVALELPPHGERTFRYALAFSPESPADASVRVARALADSDAFVANARAFNDWFARNVPRLETGNPDLLKMYLYRWFVVKRGTHDARRVVPDHEYPRRAVYESPVGGWYGCVIGLPVPVQIQEIAWMRDPGVLRDHVLNWCEKVRGYRGYIQYTGQAIARALENHPSEAFARQILPAVTQFARASAGKTPPNFPSSVAAGRSVPNTSPISTSSRSRNGTSATMRNSRRNAASPSRGSSGSTRPCTRSAISWARRNSPRRPGMRRWRLTCGSSPPRSLRSSSRATGTRRRVFSSPPTPSRTALPTRRRAMTVSPPTCGAS